MTLRTAYNWIESFGLKVKWYILIIIARSHRMFCCARMYALTRSVALSTCLKLREYFLGTVLVVKNSIIRTKTQYFIEIDD